MKLRTTYDDLFENLSSQYKDGEIDYKAFISGMETARNTYLRKDSDKWKQSYKDTSSAIESVLSERLKTIKDEYSDALKNIQDEISDMSKSLADFGDEITLTEDENGNITATINNIEDQTKAIENLGVSLEELKKRGLPESWMSELAGMNPAEALAAANALLGLSDEEWAEQTAAWDAKQQAAKLIAEKYYQDDIDTLNEKLVNSVTDMQSDMTDSGVKLGGNITDGVVQGIENGILDVEMAVTQMAQAALDAAKETLDINSPSKVMRDQVGGNISLGVAEGIASNEAVVKTAISELSNGLTAQAGVKMSASIADPSRDNLAGLNAILNMVKASESLVAIKLPYC